MAKILALDDAESVRQMVSLILSGQGHNVVVMRSGGDALAFAKKQHVDLVLSDLHMPGMTGIGLINKLRLLSGYENIPILMLTTENDPEKKQKARKFGATGWITKPITEERLITAVNKVLP